ncbi:MAG: hypothetical protein ABI837_07475 [Acidobacteriota bacterium]
MNSKRKADLQRKLSLAPVPKPPAGLAERIKNDIPHDLAGTETDRARFSRSIGFNLRVAASVLLMISSVYLVLQLLSHTTPLASPTLQTAERKNVNVAEAPASTTATSMIVANRRADEQTTSLMQTPAQPPASNQMVFAPEARDGRAAAQGGAIAQNEPSRDEPSFPNAPPPPPAARPALAESVPAEAPAIARQSSRQTAAPAPPAATLSIAQAPPSASGEIASADAGAVSPAVTSKSAARSVAPSKMAAAGARLADSVAKKDLDREASSTLFGIGVDPRAFERIKLAIEQGQQPTASNVNVDALVNYFAGPPAKVPREIRLETEISPSPSSSDLQQRLVRFTIDTPSADSSRHGVVANNASISVEFDPENVSRHTRSGAGPFTVASEAQLLGDSSVTALFELDLKAGVRPSAKVATIRLTYQAINGRLQSVERVLYVRDSGKSWSAASRRHRLASLGARWAETLKDKAGADEVARRAAELSRQQPGDSRARELAAAATASSRLQNSGRTGSGR